MCVIGEEKVMSQQPRLNHEERDIEVRPLLLFMVFLIGLIIASLATVWLLDRAYQGNQADVLEVQSTAVPLDERPPDPNVQADPDRDLREYIAVNQDELHSYGWVDQQREVVRIPIERAMELIIERGLPARGEP
jgi:hypothetical protein